ncbi:MAG: peroxiredoxin [Euryarchaeota archaeon]|nr:peroxiredoxin [Euryarchaeota archaeon]
MLDVGVTAPDFEGVDQHGNPFRLSDLRGRWVVLYFYPKDETVGCTAEACAFRDDLEALRALGAEVVGVSVQDQRSHRQFAEHHGIRFPLIADPEKRITRACEALGPLGVAKRVTYLLDPEGRIADAYRSEIKPTSHVDRVKALLQERTSRPSG